MPPISSEDNSFHFSRIDSRFFLFKSSIEMFCIIHTKGDILVIILIIEY